MRKATNHLRSVDSHFGKHITVVGPCRLKVVRARSPFLSLAESITYQQLNGTAAQTIWNRVVALFPSAREMTAANLRKITDRQLRGAGLSAAKTAALRSLAEHVEQKVIPGWAALERLEDEEIIERITQVHGIGPWTVQMLLIFSLGRPDVLPSTDYGVQKGFSIVFNKEALPKPRELLEYGERWRPYRSIASWYLWRATDLDKKKSSGRA